MASWHHKFEGHLKAALTSNEYVQRRAGLLVLHKLIRVSLCFVIRRTLKLQTQIVSENKQAPKAHPGQPGKAIKW